MHFFVTGASKYKEKKENFEKSFYDIYFIKFELDFTQLNKDFFLYYTKSFIFNFWKNGISRITGQPNINADEFLELKIPKIGLQEQIDIVNKINNQISLQRRIENLVEEKYNKISYLIKNC